MSGRGRKGEGREGRREGMGYLELGLSMHPLLTQLLFRFLFFGNSHDISDRLSTWCS